MISEAERATADRETVLAGLPPVWPDGDLRERIAQHIRNDRRCIVVLDDDPTGTQTAHDVWVVTRWEVDDLRRALASGDPALFILTNSRSRSVGQAATLNREVAANLAVAARAVGRPTTVVSRSDSTLRGHYPGEVEALAEALCDAWGISFDGTCIVPFFGEGGRFTVADVHWVEEGSQWIPAAQTAYARDPVFGYVHSSLPEWVEEKTLGRTAARDVVSISLEMLRHGGPAAVADCLRQVEGGHIVIVNAADYRDLEVFVCGLQAAEAEGKHFLFRTAASFVKVAAGLADRPLLSADDLVGDRSAGGGLIVVGSHVPKSTAQLERVLACEGVRSFELSVSQVLDEATREETVVQVAASLDAALAAGWDALVYTSRRVVCGEGQRAALQIADVVAAALADVVRRMEREPRYIIGKGGITASHLATQGLSVSAARVLGQILPGVPVWRLGSGSHWPGMPYVVFPGNVGAEGSLLGVVQALRRTQAGRGCPRQSDRPQEQGGLIR